MSNKWLLSLINSGQLLMATASIGVKKAIGVLLRRATIKKAEAANADKDVVQLKPSYFVVGV
jgi:hypothetical protein